MTFQEKHAGQTLPPYGKKGGEEKIIIDESDEWLIPISVQGEIIPVTEQEAWGIIRQIASVMQTRKLGVMVNGNSNEQ
ncbi:MAG: hypothetical protein LBK08_11720 [Treponema sp.]|jgi:hypothetical protein|nr:hypothetical protein [Treponema sp.]